jgi:hypothetical protein
MKKNLHYFIVLLLFTALFSSCIDKDYDLKNISTEGGLNPAVGLPLGYIQYNIQDVLEIAGVSDVVKEENDTLFFIYRDTMELVPNNAITIPQNVPLSVAGCQAGSGASSYTFQDCSANDVLNHILSPGERIDSLRLTNSSVLHLEVNNSLSFPVNLTLTLPKGLALVNPSEASFTLQTGQNQVYLTVKDASILELADPEFCFKYEISNTGAFDVQANSITATLSFSTLNADIIWGEFNAADFNEQNSEELKIRVFHDIAPQGSRLLFTDPIINCEVRNYIGLNDEINFEYIKAVGLPGSNPAEIYADFNGSPSTTLTVAAAPAPFQYASTFERFDYQNGKTDNLFTIDIDYISYKLDNNSSAPTGSTEFIIMDKYLDILMETKMPLIFNAGTVLITSDTLNFNMISGTASDIADDVKLRVDFENGLPIKSDLEVVFLDENKNLLPALTKKLNVVAAKTDDNGAVIEVSQTLIHLNFDESTWNDFNNAKYIVLNNQFTSDKKVKFSKTDYIRINLDFYGKGILSF